jgi:hypothetical protein
MLAPGGNILSGIGGYLQLWNWRNTAGSPNQFPTPINYSYLDVARWQLFRDWASPPNWYSGCHGSIRRRTVCADWKLTAHVWWDRQFAPAIILAQGDTTAVRAVIGAESSWTGIQIHRVTDFQANNIPSAAACINNQLLGLPANGVGILPRGESFLPAYCSPQAKFTHETITDSSEGNDDDVVMADIVLEADALLWYIANPNDMVDYGNYLKSLVVQNFIAGN